jgi:hypothetical protein
MPNAYIPPWRVEPNSGALSVGRQLVRWAKGGGRYNEGCNDLPLDVWFI